ncbi:hypothetical protein I6854_03970 [Helicobacter pylori]|uniref:hypothetical protein n=1 Tax=Helicobacter pylori TaxID=210 RepID=UPI0018D080FD|nr:hypothetical protein [Helicobacter pylori]MBH0285800.1 hypothetical protein [Helicobacter pylori]MBH0297489.1 hypothetical protein [Helicobacter pylori]
MRWSFKGVCCRISSRPISSHYGANHIKEHVMPKPHNKRSWRSLYFEFAFLGLKVIVSVKR